MKIDLLGIKVLAVIDECLKFINSSRRYKNIDSIYNIPLDDKKTYDLLSSGEVLGSFQLEGSSIAPYVSKCMPKTIDDIALILAIIR